jgi:hypothetical protein
MQQGVWGMKILRNLIQDFYFSVFDKIKQLRNIYLPATFIILYVTLPVPTPTYTGVDS